MKKNIAAFTLIAIGTSSIAPAFGDIASGRNPDIQVQFTDIDKIETKSAGSIPLLRRGINTAGALIIGDQLKDFVSDQGAAAFGSSVGNLLGTAGTVMTGLWALKALKGKKEIQYAEATAANPYAIGMKKDLSSCYNTQRDAILNTNLPPGIKNVLIDFHRVDGKKLGYNDKNEEFTLPGPKRIRLFGYTLVNFDSLINMRDRGQLPVKVDKPHIEGGVLIVPAYYHDKGKGKYEAKDCKFANSDAIADAVKVDTRIRIADNQVNSIPVEAPMTAAVDPRVATTPIKDIDIRSSVQSDSAESLEEAAPSAI